jgi:hypothetical protein
MVRSTILFALIAAAACSSSHNRNAGQADASPATVESKFDRFSGVTTIVMKPQEVIDNRDLTLRMSLEYKTGGRASGGVVDMNFEGESIARLDFPDSRLYFLADGASVTGDMSLCLLPGLGLSAKYKIDACRAFIFPLRLDQIAESKRVEMKFGSYELEVKAQLLAVLREFMSRVKAYNKGGLADGLVPPVPPPSPPGGKR